MQRFSEWDITDRSCLVQEALEQLCKDLLESEGDTPNARGIALTGFIEKRVSKGIEVRVQAAKRILKLAVGILSVVIGVLSVAGIWQRAAVREFVVEPIYPPESILKGVVERLESGELDKSKIELLETFRPTKNANDELARIYVDFLKNLQVDDEIGLKLDNLSGVNDAIKVNVLTMLSTNPKDVAAAVATEELLTELSNKYSATLAKIVSRDTPIETKRLILEQFGRGVPINGITLKLAPDHTAPTSASRIFNQDEQMVILAIPVEKGSAEVPKPRQTSVPLLMYIDNDHARELDIHLKVTENESKKSVENVLLVGVELQEDEILPVLKLSRSVAQQLGVTGRKDQATFRVGDIRLRYQ